MHIIYLFTSFPTCIFNCILHNCGTINNYGVLCYMYMYKCIMCTACTCTCNISQWRDILCFSISVFTAILTEFIETSIAHVQYDFMYHDASPLMKCDMLAVYMYCTCAVSMCVHVQCIAHVHVGVCTGFLNYETLSLSFKYSIICTVHVQYMYMYCTCTASKQ